MGKNSKKASAAADPAPPMPAAAPISDSSAPTAFQQRHPTAAKLIFAAVCIYVAMLWLLALDQTFRWGIFGPQPPPTP